MTRASLKRVVLLHLAQLTYVSEMAVSRVPRTSSCITDTCLSIMFQKSQSIERTRFRSTRLITHYLWLSANWLDTPMGYRKNPLDYGTRKIKLQERLTTS